MDVLKHSSVSAASINNMRFKQLIENEADLKKFAWSFLSWKFEDKDIWNAEDIPKLEPYFTYKNDPTCFAGDLNAAAVSADHYIKCMDDYARDRIDMRDSLDHIDIQDICLSLYLMPISMDAYAYDDHNELDDDGNIMQPPSEQTLEVDPDWELESDYPFVLVGCFSSNCDRLGSVGFTFSEKIPLQQYRELLNHL